MPYRGKNSHTLTREDQVKGGRKYTDARRIANRINARKHCAQDCPLYPCAVAHLSRTPEFGGKCAFKELPKELREVSMNLLMKGRAGVYREFTNTLNEIVIMLNSKDKRTLADRQRLMRNFEAYIKTVYGNRLEVETTEPVKLIVEFKDKWKTDTKAQGKTPKK
jgi:hypothetical protein